MVDYINYNGEKYPIRISFLALKNFEEEAGIPMSQIGENLKWHEMICWHGLVVGHKRANVELKLTRDDVQWILDENMGQYQRIFMDSMVKLQEDLTQKDIKKKK